MSRAQVLIGLLLAGLAIALVVTEIAIDALRNFWIEHPVTAALSASAILLAAGYLVFDEVVRRHDAEREARLSARAAVAEIQVVAWRFRAEVAILGAECDQPQDDLPGTSVWPVTPTDESRRFQSEARAVARSIVTTPEKYRVAMLREIIVASQLLNQQTATRAKLLRSVALVPHVARLENLQDAVDQLVFQLVAAHRWIKMGSESGLADALIGYDEVLTLTLDSLRGGPLSREVD